MKQFFTYFIILFFCLNAQSKVLILEYIGTDNVESHGESVEFIACHRNPDNCLTYFTHTFTKESLSLLLDKPNETLTAVNMSFGWEKPSFNEGLSKKMSTQDFLEAKEMHEQALKDFQTGVPLLTEMIRNNPNTLFVAASGNGILLSFIQSKGVALSDKIQLFPSVLTNSNLIKVSSINLPNIDPLLIPDYNLADYANFGLELVEVAAPVEPDQTGKVINGTSFAAPLITRLSDQIKTINPKLKPIEIKEILMKSCHVKNIDKAIEASLDLEKNGKESDVYQAMYHRKRKIREELQLKIGNIILVKCGGVVLQEVALSCAKKSLLNNVADSCLSAQQEVRSLSTEELAKIQKLWQIRKI